jgi:hypothetical protein
MKTILLQHPYFDCGVITQGSAADCEALPSGGTRAKVVLFNYDDIEEYTESNGKITDIVLKEGKFGYEFTGLGQSFKKSEDFSRSASTGLGRYKHKNTIIIYERTQAQKDNIKNLGNGRFVAVLFNKGEDADSIELAGKDVGLELQAGEIRNAHANDSFFVLNMATPEGELENETAPMQSVWDTDQETTEAMIDALLQGS